MTTERTPYHHGNLRAALLESAERMVESTGTGRLSLRELAREVGVSHGAPRQHFPEKQALLDALAESGFEKLGQELDEARTATGGPFEAQLEAFAKAWVGFAIEHPVLLDLMFASKNRPGAESLRRAADRALSASSAMITEAQARGDIGDGDHERIAMAVFAMLQGLAALITSGMSGALPKDALVAGTVDTLLTGLRPR